MIDYTPHMTNEELHEAANVMHKIGGGFASAVADAFYRADGHNRKRLLYAFGDLFVQFAPVPDGEKPD